MANGTRSGSSPKIPAQIPSTRFNKIETQMNTITATYEKKFAEMEKTITEMMNKITELQKENQEKNIKIDELQSKITDMSKSNNIKSLETSIATLQHDLMLDSQRAAERKTNIIISGNNLPAAQAWEDSARIAKELIQQKLDIDISNKVKRAQRIGKKPLRGTEDKRSILIELNDSDTKQDLFRQCKIKKPNFYINEQLTPTRSAVLYVLRKARQREGSKISHVRTIDGNVTVFIKNEEDETPKKIIINTRQRLDSFLTEHLNATTSDFITNWPTQV